MDLTLDVGELWKRMDRKSCRYAVNRAIMDGVKIKLNENYEDFYVINCRFRDAKNLSSLPVTVDFMKKYGILFVAEFNGEIVAGAFFLGDTDVIRCIQHASKRLESGRDKATLIGNASHLLIWEAMKYAKQKGIKEFDMGGYSTDSSLRYDYRFKRSFGGRVVKRFTYQKYYSPFVYAYTVLGISRIVRKLLLMSKRLSKGMI